MLFVVILIGIVPVLSGAKPGRTAEAKVQNVSGARTLKDIEYAKVDNKSLLLDLYLPEKAEGKLPLVIWIHGGGWQAGNKDGGPAVALVKQGYAIASINYRFSREAIFPAQIHDCKAAVRFLRAKAGEYNIDTGHIGVWGGSAGGHLVALLGVSGGEKALEGDEGNLEQLSDVQAVCDWFGPADFCHWTGVSDAVASNGPVARLFGEPVSEKNELAVLASPIHHVEEGKKYPPFLIMHGDADKLVPLSQSIKFEEALKKAGCDVTLYVAKGAGHGFGGNEIMKMVGDFFDKHLKPGK